jgi:hypothetical protein
LDEECLIPDILRDEEFTKKLFGDLNHDVLGPPSDGKIIVLSDFDEEEEEVCEEKTTDTKTTATSAAVNPASTTFADVNDAPARVKNDNSNDRTLDQEANGGNNGGEGTRLP